MYSKMLSKIGSLSPFNSTSPLKMLAFYLFTKHSIVQRDFQDIPILSLITRSDNHFMNMNESCDECHEGIKKIH